MNQSTIDKFRVIDRPLCAALKAFAGLIIWSIFICSGQSFAQHSLLDPSFDGDGKVFTQFLPTNNVANNSVLQSDGKIVVVGSASISTTFPQTSQAAVVRYNPDGSLDTSFDGDGKVSVSLNTLTTSTLWAAAMQADGKIVAVGRIGVVDGTAFGSSAVILRFNPDGSLDSSFDGDGKRTFDFSLHTVGSDVAVQPDGKIIMAGNTTGNSVHDFYVARFNADGSFDTSFGTNNGYTRTSFNNSLPNPKMALLADGKIILTSARFRPFRTVRYTADGLIDTSFGTNGQLDNMGGNAILQQPDDGKIIIVQNSLFDFPSWMWRFNYDGTLDSTFGSNGFRLLLWNDNHDWMELEPDFDVALDANGKIVIGGSVLFKTTQDHNETNIPTRDFGLLRLNRDGSDDLYFGFRGRVTTDMAGTDSGTGLLIQPDGKIVLAGYSSNGSVSVARYIPITANNPCRPISDFNGDGKSELAYYHNGFNNGEWFYQSSLNSTNNSRGWGLWTDIIVPADYNGDCYTDFAVYRSDGTWDIISPIDSIILNSYQVGGQAGDVPVPADFDGDDFADPAVYRNGTWIIKQTRAGDLTVQFGIAGDKPVPADYDGDGKDDAAVYRDGTWYLLQSTLGVGIVQFGLAGDKPVVGDYDGDGKTDIAVYRPSDGTWYLLQSTAGFGAVRWGIATDKPVPADYDGDGKTDIAVYRDGDWYLLQSVSGYQLRRFGSAADRPIQNAYIP